MRVLLFDTNDSRFRFLSRKTIHDIVQVKTEEEFLRQARENYFDRLLIDKLSESAARSLVKKRGLSEGALINIHGYDEQDSERVRFIMSDGSCDVYTDPWTGYVPECLKDR